MRVQSIIAPTLHYRAHGIWGERHNNPAFIARSSLFRGWSFGFRHCLGSFASTRPAVARNEGVLVFKFPVAALAGAALTINRWRPWRRFDTNSLEPAKASVTLDDVEKSGQPSQKG